MAIKKDISLPLWRKYTLTVEEASEYFGVGEKTLRRFLKEHEEEKFLIHIGAKTLIKRGLFEHYLDEYISEL